MSPVELKDGQSLNVSFKKVAWEKTIFSFFF